MPTLATVALWLTEEGGEVAEEHSEPTWLTAILAVIAVAVAAYLLYVVVRTPSPSGHHDDHGHDDHAAAGAAHH